MEVSQEGRKERRKDRRTEGRCRRRVIKERQQGLRGTRRETDKKGKKWGNSGEEHKKKKRKLK